MFNPVERVSNRLIRIVDVGLRTITSKECTRLPALDPTDETDLTAAEEKVSSQLMRINHTGEICAQALYEGQAVTARSESVRAELQKAASEERDHLAWCQHRLDELNAKPSVLNPLFYIASSVIGSITGLLSDRLNLGFVEATEDQVSKHLDKHLRELPKDDSRSREILKQIREDELRHGQNAIAKGGTRFPLVVRTLMMLSSRVMTLTTKHI